MISLLKKEFDPSVYQDPHTHRLLQFFEKGYKKPEPKQAPAEQTVSSLIYSLLVTILLAFLPPVPYGMATFFSIICDAFDPREALGAAWAWCSKLMLSCIPGVVWLCSRAWSSCVETLRAVCALCRYGLGAAWAWCSNLKQKCARWKPCAKTVPKDYHPVPMVPKNAMKAREIEFIFVDFNAWECAALASISI